MRSKPEKNLNNTSEMGEKAKMEGVIRGDWKGVHDDENKNGIQDP